MNTGGQIAEREALAVDALRSSGRLRVGVRGASMLPTLWPGDIVEVVAHSFAQLQAGEVVLIASQGRLFVHRAVGSGVDTFVARGDSMPQADPLYPASALIGKIESVVRNGRSVHSPTVPPLHHRVLGFLFCRVDFTRRVALKIYGRSRRYGSRTSSSLQAVEV